MCGVASPMQPPQCIFRNTSWCGLTSVIMRRDWGCSSSVSHPRLRVSDLLYPRGSSCLIKDRGTMLLGREPGQGLPTNPGPSSHCQGTCPCIFNSHFLKSRGNLAILILHRVLENSGLSVGVELFGKFRLCAEDANMLVPLHCPCLCVGCRNKASV